MCGIFGVVANNKRIGLIAQDYKFLTSCTIAGAVRGLDGTGFVLVNNSLEQKEDVLFHKSGATGGEYIKALKDNLSVFNRDNGYPTSTDIYLMYGHNRAATVGEVSDKTAHPFCAPHCVGIHNGTLSKGWEKRLNANKKITVDSEALMRAISHLGYEEALPKAEGAMAIVWTDTKVKDKPETYIFRNKDRSVYYCHSSLGKLYWASEKGMLEWLMARHDITVGKDGILPLPIDTVFRITEAKLEPVVVIKDTTKKTNTTTGKSTASVTTTTTTKTTHTGAGTNTTSTNVTKFPGTPSEKKGGGGGGKSVEAPLSGESEILDYVPPTEARYCDCCHIELNDKVDDYIIIHPAGKYGRATYACDNNFCLESLFDISGKLYTCPSSVDVRMFTEDWNTNPFTLDYLPYIEGDIHYEYVHDTVHARFKIDKAGLGAYITASEEQYKEAQ